MKVPDPEKPSREDDIQKDQIQKVVNKLQHQMSYVLIIFLCTPITLYITHVYLAVMILKGHRNNLYLLYLSGIQYQLPLVLEFYRIKYLGESSYCSETRASSYQLE